MRFSCSAAVGVVLFSFSLPALAQDAAARALFKEGRELAAKGDLGAACPKFEASLALEAGLGTQFNLADCWERIGRIASARRLFLEAADEAKTAGQAEREQVLRQRAEALTARVPKLLIETRPTSAKLTLKRDEETIEPATWGKEQAIDPGAYTIVAKAPGRRTWRKKIEVKADGSVVSVMIPDLPPAPGGEGEAAAVVAAPADAKAAPEPPKDAKPAPQPEPAKSLQKKPEVAFAAPPAASDRQPQLNYTVLGLGGLGIGALTFSAVMAFRYKSANDDAASICPTSRDCSSREIADHDRLVSRASTARTLGFVGAGVGLASLGAAAALVVLQGQSHSKQASQASLAAAPLVGPDGTLGASVAGSF